MRRVASNRQSPQEFGMITARVYPPPAAILLLFVLFCITSSQAQTYLVCKKPNSHDCITWQVITENGNSLDDLPSSFGLDFVCGFTNYNPRKTHRKFITIESLNNGIKKSIFCKGISELDGVFDWWQIQDLFSSPRIRREATFVPRGKYRGQTQSQYLAIDRGNGKDEGKAEAQSAADSSRASVSGNSGMGQAQSQSIYDPSCDDCFGKSGPTADSLRRKPGDTNGYGGSNWPGRSPGYLSQYGGGPGYPGQPSDSSYGPSQTDLTGYNGKPYGNTPNSRFIPGPSNGQGTGGRLPVPPGQYSYAPGGSGTGSGPGTYGTGTYSPHGTGGDYPDARESNGSGYGNGPYTATGLGGKPGEVLTSSTGSSDDPRHGSGTGYRPGQPGYIPDQKGGQGAPPTQDLNSKYSPVGRNSGNYSPGKPISGTIYPTQDGSYGPDQGTNGFYKPGQNSFIPAQSSTNGNNNPNGIHNGYRPTDVHNSGLYYGPGQRGSTGSYDPGQGPRKSYGPNGALLPPGQLSAPGSDKFMPGNALKGINGHTPVQENNGLLTPGQSQASVVKYNPNGSPTATYTPGQTGSFLPGQGSQANWPLASGPILGPDGRNYICCVVPGQTAATYNQNVAGNVGVPNNLLAPGTQYGPGNLGLFGVPNASGAPGGQNSIDSGTGGVEPSGKYGPDGGGGAKGPGRHYVPGTGTAVMGQYSPGSDPGTWRQFGQDGRPITEGQYAPGGENIVGQSSIPYGAGSGPRAGIGGVNGNFRPGEIVSVGGPGGQYTPRGTGSAVSGPSGQYVPGSGVGEPGGKYMPGSGTGSGVGAPGGQYMPGSGTGSGGQYMPDSGTGSGGQYKPGSGTGSGVGGPGGQYMPGSGTGSGGQYKPGSGTGSGVGGPGGQYMPGSGSGSGVGGPGGQYMPGSGSGSGVGGPGGQYMPGSGTSSGVGGPGGQYMPGSGPGSGVGGPGGQYMPGSGTSSGVGGPGGQYMPGSGTSSGVGGPGGQYMPGSGTGSGEGGPGGKYMPGSGTGSGVGGPGGQYMPGPGTGSGEGGPGGKYMPGSGTGSGVGGPGGQYMPGPGNGSGVGGPGEQYMPGSGTGSGIGGPGGQYMPSSGTGSGVDRPGGQYMPGTGTGSGIGGPGGQYMPSSGTGSGVGGPGGQYMPGSGTGSGIGGPGGQYMPSSGTGSGVSGPGDQYGSRSGGPGAQYGPGIDRSSGALQPGQYIPGGGSATGEPAEQYGPGGSPSFRERRPGGQFDHGSGVVVPGRETTSGISGLEGQYRPGGNNNRNNFGAGGPGQYIPVDGTGPDSRIIGPGRFIPGSGTDSEKGEPGLQYVPGGGTNFGTSGPSGLGGGTNPVPNGIGGQYTPGSGPGSGIGSPGGHYTPGSGTGYGIGSPESQYIPGSGTGSTAGVPGRQFIPGDRIGSRTGGPEEHNIPNGGNDYGKGGPNNGIGIRGPSGPGIGMNPESNNPYGNTGSQSGTQYEGGGPNNGYNGIPQNYIDPNSIIDDDDSEAEAIVSQAANGTTASAASKGGNDKGRAQTHVQGTYSGTGSFQAQAQIAGENKEAESAVSGGKKGASSSATGSGRNNKSQASVQLGSETGAVQTNSQSSGAMHSSNSQVQGSVKGGMADAQARGPGSTSSQAQIGFTPYKDGDKAKHDLQQAPFVGGGMASAQSSGRTGQSQSQLHGTFKYGIRYNGAAQAGSSLDKDAIFPNRLSFEKMDVFDDKDKNINVDLVESPPETETEKISNTNATLPELGIEEQKEEDITTTEKTFEEVLKNSESKYDIHPHADHHKYDTTSSEPSLMDNKRSFQNAYNNNGAEYEYTTDKDENDDYDSEGAFIPDGPEGDQGAEYSNYDEYPRGDTQTHQSLQNPSKKGLEVRQTTGGNTQHILLGSLKKHDAEITQKSSERPDEKRVYQPGERVPGTGGYTIPIGFTGSVKSVASKDKTYVVGSRDSPSQAQTVTLTPGTGKVRYAYPSSYGKYVHPTKLRSLHSKSDDDRYVSVSKSVTRALDNDNNIRKQYSHTYYTKSSSCGYFTFSCTMVSSAEGKKKVCKPKIPTNPDGTPIRC